MRLCVCGGCKRKYQGQESDNGPLSGLHANNIICICVLVQLSERVSEWEHVWSRRFWPRADLAIRSSLIMLDFYLIMASEIQMGS